MENAEAILEALQTRFDVRRVPSHTMLGLEVHETDTETSLSQSHYIRQLLAKFDLAELNPCKSPMATSPDLRRRQPDEPSFNGTVYRTATGSLQHIAVMTRPDITYAVNAVAKFNNDPTDRHFALVKRIFRYLKGTLDYKITFKKNVPIEVDTYCDSDYAGDLDSRRSTTGVLVTISGAPVVWLSFQQLRVALSSTEAEYRASSDAGRETVWVKDLLLSLHVWSPSQPLLLHIDNLGALRNNLDQRVSRKLKHVDVYYHFTRDCVAQNVLSVTHIPGFANPSDILTKPVTIPALQRHVTNIMTTA